MVNLLVIETIENQCLLTHYINRARQSQATRPAAFVTAQRITEAMKKLDEKLWETQNVG